ncbi:MAG: glycosyl hydrolase family 2 protein [Armatimonadota bacterium]
MASNKLNSIIHPSALMRPAPFWSWNDKLDEAELRRQIREMAEKGWGSYFMHSRVGLVTGYLSDEWFGLVNACANEAEKTGTFAWLYDEDKWPSGYAGGEVPEGDKAYRSRALVFVKNDATTQGDEILCTITHKGSEYNICKRVAALDSVWFNGASYVDLMSPEAVGKFINCTHERYKKHCGEHFGKAIPGMFTDEPCYLMQNHYDVPIVPWSDFLPDFFIKLKGYDITKKLSQLFLDIDDYRRVRFDFYDAATELFKQSFTKQYYDWCSTNNLIMTGHFMAEDGLVYQTQWSGDVMSHYEFMHWPGIDKLGRLNPSQQIVTVKQVSSAVDQLGKERSFCEAFGCMGGQASFFHRKWIGDWQAALGISFVNHHLSLYSMRGERKRDYPANLFYQQPWWQDEKGFADYEARVCAVVSEGERMVDILVLQPMATVWSEYSPLHKTAAEAVERTYDDAFTNMSARLVAEKLDFHYGNENLMAKHASVESKLFKVGRHSYSCVVVPPSTNIKSSTLELLKSYVANGGRLIFTHALPNLVDGVETVVDLPGAIVASGSDEVIAMVSDAFPDRIKVTDKFTGVNADTVLVHSRKSNESTRHLIVNSDEHRPVRATVSIPGCAGQRVSVFDLFDGSLYSLNVTNGSFDVNFAPAGSLLVICGEEARQASVPAPAVLGSGVCLIDFTQTAPAAVIRNFDCKVLEDNVLLLNDFVLYLDGKRVYEGPVCGAWHNHFYAAPDGTSFKATYTFISECEVDGAFAAIEVAENLDSITFNGQLVEPLKTRREMGSFDPAKSWKDINFTKVPLATIKTGANTLIIEGKKVNNITSPGSHVRVPNWREHEATEVEEVYLVGRFSLAPVCEGQYVIAEFNEPSGCNLTDEGFPFYSGRALLSATFDLPQKPVGRLYLKLNRANVASAVVRVNGKDCGTLRWKPFAVDITDAAREGENTLEIVMATTLVNTFGPNRRAGVKEETGIGPGTFVDMSRFKRGYELFDFGIESASLFSV